MTDNPVPDRTEEVVTLHVCADCGGGPFLDRDDWLGGICHALGHHWELRTFIPEEEAEAVRAELAEARFHHRYELARAKDAESLLAEREKEIERLREELSMRNDPAEWGDDFRKTRRLLAERTRALEEAKEALQRIAIGQNGYPGRHEYMSREQTLKIAQAALEALEENER